jgi:hypothetical protein
VGFHVNFLFKHRIILFFFIIIGLLIVILIILEIGQQSYSAEYLYPSISVFLSHFVYFQGGFEPFILILSYKDVKAYCQLGYICWSTLANLFYTSLEYCQQSYLYLSVHLHFSVSFCLSSR